MITYEQLKDAAAGVKEYDRYFTCLCPFHDDTKPSMMVFRDGWFRCLACNSSGDHKTLWRKLRNWSAPTNIEINTSWVPPFRSTDSDTQEEFCMTAHELLSKYIETFGWYLERRGVLGRLEACRLGWMDGWYTIPFYNQAHSFTGFVMRASIEVQKATGQRFYMPKNMKSQLFVPDWHLVNTAPFVIIVFGIFDALLLSELRLPVVTDNAGKEGFNADFVHEIRKPIYVIPDKGEEHTAFELHNKLGWRGKLLQLEYPEGLKDPADFGEKKRTKELLAQILKHTGTF